MVAAFATLSLKHPYLNLTVAGVERKQGRVSLECNEHGRRILIGETRVGEVFMEDAVKSGLKNASGIMLSLPAKQEVMVYLKRLMQEGRVHIPFDRKLINELNVERYEVTQTGQVKFSHPDGTHDDRLWAFALAVYASRPEIPEYHPVVMRGKSPGSGLPGRRRPDWTDWVRKIQPQ